MDERTLISSEYVSDLNRKTSYNPDESIFRGIWKEYERVMMESLVTTFGLDGFIHDVRGGDVDTLKTVLDSGGYKNARWAEKYSQRGKYNTEVYHSDKSYTQITSQARKEFNSTGIGIPDTYIPNNLLLFNKGAGPWRRAALDHVIAAHTIHDDPVRILSDIDPVSLANDPENLRYTCMSLNSKMGDKSIEDFLKWCDEHPDKVNWNDVPGATIPDEVKKRLIAEEKRAKEHYYDTVAKNYYSSAVFYQDLLTSAAKRGAEMGLRQAAGFLFVEIWMSCKEEINNNKSGMDFRSCLLSIIHGIKNGVTNALKKHDELFRKFGEGFSTGAIATLTTTLCNIFDVTSQNRVKYLRQGYVPIIQAGSILLINPDDLFLGDQLKEATIALGTGASMLAGTMIGDQLAKTPIAQIPHVGKLIVRFASVLVSGLLSCTFLIILDRSKYINELVLKMNQYASEEHRTKSILDQFEKISAELANYDIQEFKRESSQWHELSVLIQHADNEVELNRILIDAANRGLYKLPWTGDFRTFMSNRNNTLDFS